ncbi:PQQ-binding-like beta-propeller repeat protein [Alteromonas sp. D210916BOD_24]
MFLRIVLLIVLISGSIGCSIPDTTPLKHWRHVEEGAYAADISTDGTITVVSGVNNGINVWRIGDSEPLYHWGHQGEGNNSVMAVHISADKRYVVTADREAFALWSMQTGEPEGFWRIDESSIRDVAVANNGNGILVARSSGKVMYFEPRTSRRLEFLGHQEKVNSIDISPNGKFALTGGNDYIAYLWSTETGQIIHTFTHPTRVTKVALDDEGRFAFTADSQDKSQIWNVQTGQPVSALNYISRQKIFTDAEFSKDGKYLLTGSPSRKSYLWDVQTGDQLQAIQVASRETVSPPTAVVYGVAFMPDGNMVTTSSSGLTEVWLREK